MHSNDQLPHRENTSVTYEATNIDGLNPSLNFNVSFESIENEAAPTTENTVLAPSVFGRYLLSDKKETAPVQASLEKSKAFERLVDHAQLSFDFNYSKPIDIKLKLSSAIYSRDFLILLGIIKILKNNSLHYKNVDGGITFLASDLRDILSLSGGGENTIMIEQSLERLSEIEASLLATQENKSEVIAHDHLISEYATGGERMKGKRRQRHWYLSFSVLAKFLMDFSSIEQTRYDINELIIVRKQAASLAVKAHYQTVNYQGGKVYGKRLSTLAENCNLDIDENLWIADSKYRNRKSNKLVRVIKSLSLNFEMPKRITYLLSTLITFQPQKTYHPQT